MLRVGMYVSKLDRPWLETPFLFQGFFIRSDSDIEELKRYCEYVEIDVEQCDPALQAQLKQPPAKRSSTQPLSRSRANKGSPFWNWIKRLFGVKTQEVPTDPQPGEFYSDTSSTADELVVARTAHSGSLSQMMDILDGIRRGKSIAMPDLEVITGTMVDSVLRNNTAMALLARLQKKDEYTGAHSLASSIWALVFGRHLGLDRDSLSAVGLGALLLDVGKMKLPEELLNKPGPLDEAEKILVHNHVGFSLELIRESEGVDNRVIDMVATHHERYDGSGYPRAWRGNQIPVFGRIAGIVDSYSAMTSDRPYASAKSSFDAMRELKSLSDKHFQAEMVEQFIQAVGIFPTGTLVELNTGEIGIVMKEHQSARLRPELAIILDANKEPMQDFKVLNLRDDSDKERTVWITRGLEPGAYDIDPTEYFL